MKRLWLMFLIITSASFLLVGCGSKSANQPPHIEGLIYSIEDHSILVIEDIDSVDISVEEWQGKPAYSVRITDKTKIYNESGKLINVEDLHVGDIAQVWIDGEILESYPAQVRAAKIQVGK